ncbi:MAG: Crp/Fnr family transcriptional regulator [Oscillospiraceae bacterium]|nr:Crp/Fnr family transcriptional regulator [Oscillospiraceae bacterium]
MKATSLYHVAPFLKTINGDRRKQFENYFATAPLWLLESLTIEEMKKGTIFTREGEPADTIYFIATGAIKATDYRIYGISYDFMMILKKVYAYGGMEVIMDLDTYRTTLQTVTKCTVLKVPRVKFQRWLMSDIEALKNESKLVAEYLLEEARNSRAFLFLQGADRLAFLFINRYDKYADHGVLRMKGNRKELSDSTGLCLKTINRAIKKFCECGMVTIDGRDLLIDQAQYLKLKDVVTPILAEDY